MPAIARKTDKNTDGKILVTKLATSVVVNNLSAAVVGSTLVGGASLVLGSKTVNIEKNPAAFVTSKDTNSKAIVSGSNNVNIGK